MTSSNNKLRQPTVPSRSSSISATRRERQSQNARNSLLIEDAQRSQLLRDYSQSTSATPVHLRSRSPETSKMSGRSTSCAPATRSPLRPSRIQRWAGLSRSVNDWDDLRKDPELWAPDGDCDVHLYARGASRRGPSFRVPLKALREQSCNAMLQVCYAHVASGDASNVKEGQLHSFDDVEKSTTFVDLYIPAPDRTSREDSFDWHITTRNFFAYILGKPLVGQHMGQTFVNLQERMRLFRSEIANNQQDFLQYIEEQGYRDLVECTDYALASLYYAEQYKIRQVWIDAFTHCVGMNESLALSPEYTAVSRVTKALITRAYIEVDIHIGNVAKALRVFLHDDFSPVYLGLTDPARSHMDHFRRFLHRFYVEKFGYWPPPKSTSSFPKALYKSMFFDFQNLYEYLADTASTSDITTQKPAIGGICVLQNLDSFDKRHKFTPQTYPLPLLPHHAGSAEKTGTQRLSRSFSSTSKTKKARAFPSKSAALAAAANMVDPRVVNSKMVQAYMQFERSYALNPSHREDKLSAVDARKVRWLVIYGTLQYLSSVLKAPKEVRDTDAANYPLCCLVAPQASWSVGSSASTRSPVNSPASPQPMNDYFSRDQSSSSSEIQPDCQREDYFISPKTDRFESVEMPAPLKIGQQPRPLASRALSQLSILSARTSRRNSLTLKPTSHCAILVHGYGDGLNEAKLHTEESEEASAEVPWLSPRDAPVTNQDVTEDSAVRGHSRQRTPLLQTFQLDAMSSPTFLDDTSEIMSRSDSTSSTASSVWTDEGSATSSKSSTDGDKFYRASAAEYSGLLGGLVSVNGTPLRLSHPTTAAGACTAQSDIHPLLRTSPIQESFQFGFDDETVEIAEFSTTTEPIGVALSPPSTASAPAPTSVWDHVFPESNVVLSCPLSRTPSQKPSVSNMLRSIPSPRPEASSAVPPTVTKTSHAAKTPSRINRFWNEEVKTKKTEKRLSSFFRR